jgi:hypothetical protein
MSSFELVYYIIHIYLIVFQVQRAKITSMATKKKKKKKKKNYNKNIDKKCYYDTNTVNLK